MLVGPVVGAKTQGVLLGGQAEPPEDDQGMVRIASTFASRQVSVVMVLIPMPLGAVVLDEG